MAIGNQSTKKGFAFEGSEVIQRFLAEFPRGVEANIINQSTSKAVKTVYVKNIKAKVRGVVKKRTGNLLKGVKSGKAPMVKMLGAYRVYMGAPAYHSHLVERGTKERKAKKFRNVYFIKSRGKTLTGLTWRSISRFGKMKATPFFVPVFQGQYQQEALGVLRVEMTKRTSKYIQQIAKKV